jgi:DnaJ-class molecular chaperone
MIEKNRKMCERCNGEGKINIRREEQRIYDNWDPKRHGTYEWVDIGDECPNCRGKGYLELKWE